MESKVINRVRLSEPRDWWQSREMLIEHDHFTRLREPENLLPLTTTPSSAASPYSSFIPNLITYQAFAQELWKT